MSSSIFSALAAASRIPSAQPEHLRPLHVSATVKAAGHADGFRRDRPDHPLHDRLSHWLRCHAGETLIEGISFHCPGQYFCGLKIKNHKYALENVALCL